MAQPISLLIKDVRAQVIMMSVRPRLLSAIMVKTMMVMEELISLQILVALARLIMMSETLMEHSVIMALMMI